MQGIYTHIPETNYVPREHGVAAILLFLFMVLILLLLLLLLLLFAVAQQPNIGHRPSVLHVSRYVMFYGEGLMAPRPTPNLEDQVSLFVTPGQRVAHCTPRHWVARNQGLATSGTHSKYESLRRGARYLYVSPR